MVGGAAVGIGNAERETMGAVDDAIQRYRTLPGALLPILHAIQDRIGHVPQHAVPRVADALNISRAEVHGVLTFYHDFRTHRPGRHIVKVCRAEACQAMGSDRLAEHAKAHLGIDFHQTTADGNITLEPVYCLGNCALSPAVLVDGRLYGRVTLHRFQEIVREEMETA